MTPPPPHNEHRGDDDSQTRRRPYEGYYPSIAERVTILEQKHKMQNEANRNEIENVESSLRESVQRIETANASLQAAVHELHLQVNALKIRSGILGTMAGVIAAAGFFLLEIIRQRLMGK